MAGLCSPSLPRKRDAPSGAHFLGRGLHLAGLIRSKNMLLAAWHHDQPLAQHFSQTMAS